MQEIIIFFVQEFYWIITASFRKFNSFIIVFRDKVFDFIDRHLFIATEIFTIHIILYRKTQKAKKKKEKDFIEMKNSIKNGDNK